MKILIHTSEQRADLEKKWLKWNPNILISSIPSDWMFNFHMFWLAYSPLFLMIYKLWQNYLNVNKLVIDSIEEHPF